MSSAEGHLTTVQIHCSRLYDHWSKAPSYRSQAQVIGQCSEASNPMPKFTDPEARSSDPMSKAIGRGQFLYIRFNVTELIPFACTFQFMFKCKRA